jgi:hypothetical protein
MLGIRRPLPLGLPKALPVFKSSIALVLGVAPVALIPAFCAKEICRKRKNNNK